MYHTTLQNAATSSKWPTATENFADKAIPFLDTFNETPDIKNFLQGNNHLTLYPRAIPLTAHHPIIEGNISTEQVLKSFADYHPAAREAAQVWDTIWNTTNNSPLPKEFIDNIPSVLLPPIQQDIPIMYNNLTTNTKARFPFQQEYISCQERVLHKAQVAISLFNTKNPDKYQQYLPNHVTPLPPTPSTSAVSIETPSHPPSEVKIVSKTDRESAVTTLRIKQRLYLFGSYPVTNEFDEKRIHLPKLNTEFTESLTMSSTLARDEINNHIDSICENRKSGRDYLEKLTSIQDLAHAEISALKNFTWINKDILHAEKTLQYKLSIFNFLPKQDAINLTDDLEADQDELLNTDNPNRRRRATKMNISTGRLSTIDDVLSTIANLDAILHFYFNHSDQACIPLITKHIRGLADIISSRGFDTWFSSNHKSYPHIPAMLLTTSLQNILSAHVDVAYNPTYLRFLQNNQDLPYEAVEKPSLAYSEVIRNLRICIAQSSPGIFATKSSTVDVAARLGMYTMDTKPNNKRQKTSDRSTNTRDSTSMQNTNTPPDKKTRGYIVNNNGVRISLPFCQEQNKKHCLYFALEGKSCTRGSQCNMLHVPYSNMDPNMKASITNYINSTPGISLSSVYAPTENQTTETTKSNNPNSQQNNQFSSNKSTETHKQKPSTTTTSKNNTSGSTISTMTNET